MVTDRSFWWPKRQYENELVLLEIETDLSGDRRSCGLTCTCLSRSLDNDFEIAFWAPQFGVGRRSNSVTLMGLWLCHGEQMCAWCLGHVAGVGWRC